MIISKYPALARIMEQSDPAAPSKPVDEEFFSSVFQTISVGDLRTYSFNVSCEVSTAEVVEEFKKNPFLPGVLILENGQRMGMISRYKCFELLSRPFGVEIFLKRSIMTLYADHIQNDAPVPYDTSVDQAVQMALLRSQDRRYEPLVVVYPDQPDRLLDMHDLLLQQNRMVTEANRRSLAQIQISRALSSTLDLRELLEIILQQINTLAPHDRAGIYLVNGESLELLAIRGSVVNTGTQSALSLKELHNFEQVRNTLKPYITYGSALGSQTGRLESRVWLSVPLICSSEVIGMISLMRSVSPDRSQENSDAPRGFHQEEIEHVSIYSAQASIALQNARLVNEIKDFNHRLESLIEERTGALEQAMSKLQRLDKTKTDFITVAAHELRTPLTVMSGYCQILQEKPVNLTADQVEMLQGIMGGITRLNQIVKNMVDAARIDQKTLNLNKADVNLTRFMDEIFARFSGMAAERKIHLSMGSFDPFPVIEMDREEMAKVFFHLISNAIKYTPDGGTISVYGMNTALENRPAMEWVILDSGIGICPEDREMIFEKFYHTGELKLQSSSAYKFKGGGSGLGLSIARGIVEAHRGKIWVESPGWDEKTCPGSAFHVVLPFE